MSLWSDDSSTPILEDSEAPESVPSPIATASRSKRARRRAEKALIRQAHDEAHTRELRAICAVIEGLPAAVPSLQNQLATFLDRKHHHKQTMDELQLQEQQRVPSKLAVDEDLVQDALTAISRTLETGTPYRSLREAYGHSEGTVVLRDMIDRPPKYQEKYLAQEASLLFKIWALATHQDHDSNNDLGTDTAVAPGGGKTGVIDIGAGNGCLALLAAILLDGFAVLIDHTLPPEELRVELKVPECYRNRILRITGDVRDIDIDAELEPLLNKHGIQKVVVVAKHLCGTGTDLALSLVKRWRSHCIPGARQLDESRQVFVCGAIFATCCGHKIGAGDRKVYADLHHMDPYLQSLTTGDDNRLLALLTLCTRCVAWRTTASSESNRILASQVQAAELFEDTLQEPRLNLLRNIFPAALEIVFVPKEHSPQNRCLIAGSVRGVREAVTDSDASLSALQHARNLIWESVGGPLDLRPRGFVSSKYEYDGT